MKKIDNMIRNEVYHPVHNIIQNKITNQLHFEIWNTVAVWNTVAESISILRSKLRLEVK